MWLCPFQAQFVVRRRGFAMLNQQTKSEVSMFMHYKDMKGTIRQNTYDFLFN